MEKRTSFAVFGAGNGGHAMAADLSMRGFRVNLFELPEFEENIKPIQKKGGIYMTGFAPDPSRAHAQGWEQTGFAKIQGKVTTDPEEAVEDTDVVMIVTPAYGQEAMVKACAPHLLNGQILIFHTGNWASLRFAGMLEEMDKEDVILAETSILIYSCHRTGPASVDVGGIKEKLSIAALPASNTGKVIETLKKAYPQFFPAKNVLQTSLENFNHVAHPALMILNTASIENSTITGAFAPYACSASVAKVMEAVDKERMALANALDIDTVSQSDWLNRSYGAKGKNLYEIFQDCKIWTGKAPKNMKYRYMTEDIPYGLVPMASLGDLLKVPTPTIKGLITLGSIINETDYVKEGITVEKLGLAGMTTEDIIRHVN